MNIMDLLTKTGGLLEGHFLLSSGLHSPGYLQCAKMLAYPQYAQVLGQELGEKFSSQGVEIVIGPALGGIIIAHEVARALGVRAIFAERQEDKMCLRRGFEIKEDERVLVVEDVITTGGSVLETIVVTRSFGAKVIGVGVLIDRSGGRVDLGVPLEALAKLEIEIYSPDTCPLCRENIPLVKPGSRKIVTVQATKTLRHKEEIIGSSNFQVGR